MTTAASYKPGSTTPNAGSWRHPAMDTIVERSKRKGLADISHIRLAKNSAVLLGTYILAWLLQSSKHYLAARLGHPFFDDVMFYGGYILYALRILFLWNILESGYRLFRKEPDFSDLALTPMQRKLLGLNPNVASKGPPDGYVTPPRYHKSSASSSPVPGSSPGSIAGQSYNQIYNDSSPARRSSFASGEPPMTPSPLRSTIRGGTQGTSLGFTVQSLASSHQSLLSTPSPKNRVGQGLGLGYGNVTVGTSGVPVGNRWIYDKMGRRGEGFRWTPERNQFLSPIKGQIN